MRKTLSFLSFILLLNFSCKKETATVVENDEPVNIEFMKEGDLQLINNDTIIKNVDIEFAKDANERNIGLMNRNAIAENEGMLFIFAEDNGTGFWMKNTRIPLDIIFIGADSTVITVSKNRQPFDERSEGATKPYRYVLELNGGMADKWGVQEGVTRINWTEL